MSTRPNSSPGRFALLRLRWETDRDALTVTGAIREQLELDDFEHGDGEFALVRSERESPWWARGGHLGLKCRIRVRDTHSATVVRARLRPGPGSVLLIGLVCAWILSLLATLSIITGSDDSMFTGLVIPAVLTVLVAQKLLILRRVRLALVEFVDRAVV